MCQEVHHSKTHRPLPAENPLLDRAVSVEPARRWDGHFSVGGSHRGTRKHHAGLAGAQRRTWAQTA